MKSLDYKNMLNKNSCNLVSDSDATLQNLILLLKTEKGTLVADPEFGISLKKYLFNQNHIFLKDILIDEIYNAIALFMPQLLVNRKDISIIINNQPKATITVKIRAVNQIDLTTNMYQLNLYNEDN